MENEIEGIVFKIKRFSLHDGPGIRTSVFLKGCPLNCIWCHSPEGITSEIGVWYNENLCIICGKCINSCPESALTLISDANKHIKIDYNICKVSGECSKICPTNALQLTGSVTKVTEVIKEIEKDLLFYQKSGGGVTLTGGEPLLQPEFSTEILRECKKRNIHTAIETSLFCEKKSLEKIMEFVDLFITDIKIFNSARHQIYTGKSNETILDNFQFISRAGKDVIVRIPMVKNITDTNENISSITEFVKKTDKNIVIEKISYNPLTENNYKKLGLPFLLKEK